MTDYKQPDYKQMVNAILQHMTERELSILTGNTETSVRRWKKGTYSPGNLIAQDKIKELYSGLTK